MALSGIQIYKMLPKTNCKDCGFPTCLAFAMKLAAKQVELSDCPHVSEEAHSRTGRIVRPTRAPDHLEIQWTTKCKRATRSSCSVTKRPSTTSQDYLCV